MSENENKLLPQVPVLSEYEVVKTELEAKIKKLNSITELTEENKKEVKTGIAEINKVKERISRYRIDETNRFLEINNKSDNSESFSSDAIPVETLCHSVSQ